MVVHPLFFSFLVSLLAIFSITIPYFLLNIPACPICKWHYLGIWMNVILTWLRFKMKILKVKILYVELILCFFTASSSEQARGQNHSHPNPRWWRGAWVVPGGPRCLPERWRAGGLRGTLSDWALCQKVREPRWRGGEHQAQPPLPQGHPGHSRPQLRWWAQDPEHEAQVRAGRFSWPRSVLVLLGLNWYVLLYLILHVTFCLLFWEKI